MFSQFLRGVFLNEVFLSTVPTTILPPGPHMLGTTWRSRMQAGLGGLFHRRHLIAHISLCYIIGTWRPEPASLEYLFLNAKEHRRPSPLNACPESDPRDSRSFCLVPAYSGLLWVKPSQAKGVNSGGGFVKTAFEERPLTGSFTNAGVDGCR